MEVSLGAALPPVAIPDRLGGGASGYAQAAPAVANWIPPKIDTPSSTPSQADISGTAETRNTPSQNQLAQAIKQVNDAFSQKNQNLYASFEEDKATGIQVVKIVEKKTNEIIRQMPPKEIIAFAQSFDAAQGRRGQLILDKA